MIRHLAILLMLLIVACEERGRETTLPPLPDVALAPFEPAVRRQLEDALVAARSQPHSGEVNRRLGMLLHAYGWQDRALRHDFYEVDFLPENNRFRYTIHPEARKEILRRLLTLNHARYAEEQAKKTA